MILNRKSWLTEYIQLCTYSIAPVLYIVIIVIWG